jgi:hypothetical protein
MLLQLHAITTTFAQLLSLQIRIARLASIKHTTNTRMEPKFLRSSRQVAPLQLRAGLCAVGCAPLAARRWLRAGLRAVSVGPVTRLPESTASGRCRKLSGDFPPKLSARLHQHNFLFLFPAADSLPSSAKISD